MPRHRIQKIVVTTADGREHTYEGEGSASIVTTTTKKDTPGQGDPVARLEASMALSAEWQVGDDGRYISVPGSTL